MRRVTASLAPETLDRFQRSLERCLSDHSFVSRFYARLMLSSDEVAKKFEGTDLKKQATVLKRSLYMVLRAAHQLEDGLEHLAAISRSHSARGLDISPRLYRHWLDTLLAVMRETEPDYEPELDQVWRAVLVPVIDHMIEHYAQAES